MIYPLPFIQYCDELKLKLTSLRKAVLYILWCEKRPLKAYEILDKLLKIKSNSTPPTVYRALLFFVACDVVHKIESIQSYTLCGAPEKHQPSEVLMVCSDCHQVLEVYDLVVRELVEKISDANDFKLKQNTIELNGICQACQLNF